MSHRKRCVFCAAILAPLLSWLLAAPVAADVPHLIRYQGTAVDVQGVALEGPYTLTFRLYDAATAGTKVWEETQPDVPVTQGHFSVLLGSVTPLNQMDWAQPCWLAILVNGEELLPRQAITSVPLAIRAERVNTSGLTDDAHTLVPSGVIVLTATTCPSGYTEVTSMYAGMLKIGATATPSAATTTAELPAHAHPASADIQGAHGHTFRWRSDGAGGDGPAYLWAGGIGTSNSQDRSAPSSIDSNGAHTHAITVSSSGTATFSTLRLCQKD